MGTDDRMRHTFILGQTGTGKSTLMEHMILQDIRDGRGLALLDPHGELVESVLGKIPADRQKDVVLFDMLE
jgi:type IV secretory pathway VirB4 component